MTSQSQLRLWRGDTTAKLHVHDFRTEGIVTKQLLGGDPDYVSREGLWKAVQDHVAPVCPTEKHFCETSSFLSFSSSRETGLRFAAGREGTKLALCADYDESAVIFELNLSGMSALGEAHVYAYNYACNYGLVKPNVRRAEGAVEARLVRCGFCDSTPQTHTLLLIDVPKFLRKNPRMASRTDALSFAERDSEWLVLPVDYVASLKGFQSRIPPADFWRAQLFRFAHNATASC